MSTALGIASVTYVLKDLLNNGLVGPEGPDLSGNVQVTALPPDRIDLSSPNEQSSLNLFMYQAGLNPSWRNEGLPARDAQGQRVSNPPLALDLHYFLTAYGAEELHAEILLGYGMQLLHENPVLSRDAIRQSLAVQPSVAAAGLPPALRQLATSELAEQVEQLKVTPESLNAEEISRLWTAFQAKYRPTAAYKVTVVLIQRYKSARAALPVQRRQLYVLPFHQPVIDQLLSQAPADGSPVVENQKILTGYHVVVMGRQLRHDQVSITIDGEPLAQGPAVVSDTQLVFSVPATLAAGAHGVQVVHPLWLGEPPAQHRGSASNLAALVLSPTLSDVGYDKAAGGSLKLTITPAVVPTQRVLVLLNELTASGQAYSFRLPPPLPADAPPVPTASLTIPVPGVKPGHYLVRVQVDGAESPLLATDNKGAFTSPQVHIS